MITSLLLPLSASSRRALLLIPSQPLLSHPPSLQIPAPLVTWTPPQNLPLLWSMQKAEEEDEETDPNDGAEMLTATFEAGALGLSVTTTMWYLQIGPEVERIC